MKKRLLFIISFLILLLGHSCKKDNDIFNNEESIQKNRNDNYDNNLSSDGEIVLGRILNDPYKFENMLMARDQLANERSGISTPVISATHKYMRCKPKNEEELDMLKADTNLLLWDFPLHYEIVVAGTYYHDPSITDNSPTWQYFVIPNDYQLPAISSKYELIYTLYFPEENSKNSFYYDLEERAYLITGNLQDEKNTRASEWTPSAVIKAYDDIVGGYIPLQGVKVTARRFTKAKTGITDANGYCTVDGTFKNPVNYSIKWERAYWDIRNGAIGQAYYNGPKQEGQWNLEIGKGGESLMFATIHRAAFKFHYGNCLGVKRPILNTGKTKIAYHDKDASWGTGCCWGTWEMTGIIPDIMIAHPKSTQTDTVFATSIHELGHQSHLITLDQSLYANLKKEIHESWAAAIEWRLTNHHYNNELNKSYSHYPNYQSWYPGNLGDGKTYCYTPLFIDLMDNYNQGANNSRYPNDKISGYDITFIQNNIIPTSRSLETFHTALKNNKINNITDADIDLFITLYWNQDYSRK